MLKLDNETKQRVRDEMMSYLIIGPAVLFAGVAMVFAQTRYHIGGDVGDGLFATGAILASCGLYGLYQGFMRAL